MEENRENAVADAVKAFAEGKIVLVMDDFDRENECDMIALGETLTKEQMATMIKYTTGIICVVAEKGRLEGFGLYPAAHHNTDPNGTNFYVATDYLVGTTTGVSAGDRVATVKAMCDKESRAKDFSKPGHMFPLCPREGGVLERGGHTESAYDLCRLAGKNTVSVIGELMREDGEMMRFEESVELGKKFGMPIISVEELRAHIRKNPIQAPLSMSMQVDDAATIISTCAPCSEATLPVITRRADKEEFHKCKIFNFPDAKPSPIQVVVAQKGYLERKECVPVRIHSECFTGDVLRSAKCDCGLQLNRFFNVLEDEENGALLYVRGHEGRGIGLEKKLDAYKLQETQDLDTVDANLALDVPVEARSYAECAQVLQSLGMASVRLYTNNPEKIEAIKEVMPCEAAALRTTPLKTNISYLRTKENRMRHRRTTDDTPTTATTPALPAGSPRTSVTGNQMSHTQNTPPTSPFDGLQPKIRGKDLEGRIEWPAFGQYKGFKVAVVYTAWNRESVMKVVSGCEELLQKCNAEVTTMEVPGAQDLVAGAATACEAKPHAVICIGVFVQGETVSANEYFSSTLNGLQALNASGKGPVICGVQFCKSEQQAQERSTPALGAEWAKSALQMCSLGA
jgi:3,4-dihydroxy-2-butanone 4-phosphate synthase/GTP cyclohydrolase II